MVPPSPCIAQDVLGFPSRVAGFGSALLLPCRFLALSRLPLGMLVQGPRSATFTRDVLDLS